MEMSRLKWKEYHEELQKLKEQIPILAQKKKDAKEEGDLSENTEYEVASAEFNKAILRQAELEELTENSIIIEPDNGPQINLGCFVRIECLSDKSIPTRILRVDNEGSTRADKPYNRILGIASPLGRAIYHGVSGKYEIQTERGKLIYNVTKIAQNEAFKEFEKENQ